MFGAFPDARSICSSSSREPSGVVVGADGGNARHWVSFV